MFGVFLASVAGTENARVCTSALGVSTKNGSRPAFECGKPGTVASYESFLSMDASILLLGSIRTR